MTAKKKSPRRPTHKGHKHPPRAETEQPAGREPAKARRKAVHQLAKAARQRLDRQRPFAVVYEDDDILVVNKRGGLLAVPVRESRAENLWHLLNTELHQRGERVLVVHRIDRYTSGLITFAKNKMAWQRLIEQFRAHTPRREYIVLVRGRLPAESGELCHYLRLTRSGFRQLVVADGSKGTKALLHYKVLAAGPKVSLVNVRLETGLKNQIRVQFLAAGNPVVGDRHYVGAELSEGAIDRQALHASLLALEHPATRKRLTFEAPLPRDFLKLLKTYGLKLEQP